MDRFKLTKQDRINQYKIIMYNVKNDLEYFTRPDTVRRIWRRHTLWGCKF